MKGEKVDSGHYYSINREDTSKDDWYIFNDKEVFELDDSNHLLEYKVRRPYLLFYKRKGNWSYTKYKTYYLNKN